MNAKFYITIVAKNYREKNGITVLSYANGKPVIFENYDEALAAHEDLKDALGTINLSLINTMKED